MDEKDIIMLTELMKTRNITRTAELLYTTQPAITRRLKRIEEDLGCELFLRTKKGVIITPDAEVLLPRIQEIAESMEQIRSYTSSRSGEITGSLKVGFTINYARYHLPEVLANFVTKYPKVDLQLYSYRSPDLYRKLTARELQIVVIGGDYPWTEGDILLSEENVYLLTKHEISLEQLRVQKNSTYIGRDMDTEFTSDLNRWRCENNISADNKRLIINDVETIVAILNKGVGWSILPQLCLQNFNGYRKPLYFQDGTPFLRRTHILYRHDYFQLPQVQAFLTVLKEHAGSFQADMESSQNP